MTSTLRGPALLAVCLLFATAACSSGGGGQSASSAKQEITTRWETFWGNKGSTADLENGQQLQAAYAAESTNPLAKSTTAKVHSVDLLNSSDCKANGVPSPCAKVTYDIVVNGQPALPNAAGYAVKQNGKWLVSKATFCSIGALGNNNVPPPGC
jgi:hypothetical protein